MEPLNTLPAVTSWQMVIALMTPVVLLVSMYWTFRLLARRFGLPLGYLLGFVIYWLFWCLLVPMLILGQLATNCGDVPPVSTVQHACWQTQLGCGGR